jgi:hypothetical protein
LWPDQRRQFNYFPGGRSYGEGQGARTTARTMYREMGMTCWLQKAEAKLKA